MSDYKDLPYFTLKQECKKAGLSAAGNKVTLLARLEGINPTDIPDLPEPEVKAPQPAPEVTVDAPIEPEVQAPPPVNMILGATAPIKIEPATPAELAKFAPTATVKPSLDTSRYKAWLTPCKILRLSPQLNHKSNYCIYIRFDSIEYHHRTAAFICDSS